MSFEMLNEAQKEQSLKWWVLAVRVAMPSNT